MALSLFNPSLTRDLFSVPDEFFGPLMRPFDMPTMTVAAPRAMPIDVKETDEKFELKADVPSVKKDDIRVTVDNNVLSIKVS